MKKGHRYYSYYPFNRENFSSEDTKEAIPVSIKGQSIDGNDMFGHLGKYDPMFAQSENTTGSIAWDFQHLVSWLKLNVTLAADCSISEIILSSEDGLLHTEGLVDLTTEEPAISATNDLTEISIPCKNLNVKADVQTVIPVAIIPTNLNGKNIKIKLVSDIGVYIFVLPIAKEWKQGFYYSQTLTNNASTQQMLNDKLLVNQLFTVNYNVESISWDTEARTYPWEANNIVTFSSNYNNLDVEIENAQYNIRPFFTYNGLKEKANLYSEYNYVSYLLFKDEQDDYYRIPLAGELALLLPFSDYVNNNTSNKPNFVSSGSMTSEFAETLQVKPALTDYVSDYESGQVIGTSKMIKGSTFKQVKYLDISYNEATIEAYPVFALRLKGSEQYAAYKYELKNLDSDFVLSIKIKGLHPDDNVTTLEDISSDNYWETSYVEHIIPATGLYWVEGNAWARARSLGYVLSANVCKEKENAIWLGGFDCESCYTTNGHDNFTFAYPLRLVKTSQDWWKSALQ